MAGLVPAIHVLLAAVNSDYHVMRGLDPRIHQPSQTFTKRMDSRVKPGYDASREDSVIASEAKQSRKP